MNVPGVAFEGCTELIATHTMRERKAVMEQRSDAFIALPGGFGTLEEILEIITLRQLGYHKKPVVLINTLGFYDSLAAQFEQIILQRFADKGSLSVFGVVSTPGAALDYIENAAPASFVKRFDSIKE
jgi:TIGR00730 family protein